MLIYNKLFDNTAPFPPNVADQYDDERMRSMTRWIMQNFTWPYILARRSLETKWDDVHKMYKIEADIAKYRRKRGENWRNRTEEDNATREEEREPEMLADTVIFDAVDRLTNLNYFLSWKDGLPAQYNRPKFLSTPFEDAFYAPTSNKLKLSNALLDYNISAAQAKTKDQKLKRHLYLYGICLVFSDFLYKLKETPMGVVVEEAYTMFEPMSLRRCWFDLTLPIDQMDLQPCPFFFEMRPRFSVMQNQYHPQMNPFGFVNLQMLKKAEWPGGWETEAWRKVLETGHDSGTLTQIMESRPEFQTEALWTFYPMLPVDEKGLFNENGTPQRFIVQFFANNLYTGKLMPIRVQELYYPKDKLPIFGAASIPDLDSGFYTPSLGSLLSAHYHELVTAKQQYRSNKNWINNPPSWHTAGSLAANQDVNKPGVRIEVASENEFGWRPPFDATFTTIQYIQMIRDAAQTSSKAVDAIMGKAMGQRTTATEASNAFQTSMSAITSDIDQSNTAIYGVYADRVWENAGRFLDPDLISRITGKIGGDKLDAQDLYVRVGIKTDVGSSFVESVVRQQHLRYAIEAATRSPVLDQPTLWKAFFKELRLHEALEAVVDQGTEYEINLANEQAIRTYLGEKVLISPTQNHQIAIKTKTRYLEDHNSRWNLEYAGLPAGMPDFRTGAPQTRALFLAQQIEQHQQFQMIIMQQQMLEQQGMAEQANDLEVSKKVETHRQTKQYDAVTTAGAARSQNGQRG